MASDRARLAFTCSLAVSALGALGGCSATPPVHRFPLRDVMWQDADQIPFSAPCSPDPKKPGHANCTLDEYESPFAWDGVDSMIFRPISRFFAVDPAEEAVNVNALDEVPDSSWFTNRIGVRPMTPEEVAHGNCDEKPLNVDDADGTWLIDQGKENGFNPGFRVTIPGAGKFLLKADESDHPERATGATAIATRLYHAAGYFTGCDSVIYIRRSLLKLKPGLTYSDNTGVSRPFGEKQLEKVLSGAARRGDKYRLVASKWLPGHPLGPFTYAGLRKDDPNDVVAHEDRRELRGQRLLAAWLNHFDSREQNSMNTWVAVNAKDPDSSPGYVRHWIIDLNDCFGSEWKWDGLTKRINFSSYFDGSDVATDFITLGIPERPWDDIHRPLHGEIFGYYESEQFEPEGWKPGYPNPAFVRMTERDGAWMARILARFTPRHIAAAVEVGDFTKAEHRQYLLATLIERQQKILARYFAQVSPVTDFEVRERRLCAVDLARKRHVYEPARFAYSANVRTGMALEELRAAKVTPEDEGALCVDLPRIGEDGGQPDDSPARYLVVEIANGASTRPVRVHLYDLGPSKGYRIVGAQR